MVVVSSSEFREKQSMYFDMADKNEKIVVQRSKSKAYSIRPVPSCAAVADSINDDDGYGYVEAPPYAAAWLAEYFAIPEEYRCNPFDCSPSGDIFFADKRNLAHIDEALQQVKRGEVWELTQVSPKR